MAASAWVAVALVVGSGACSYCDPKINVPQGDGIEGTTLGDFDSDGDLDVAFNNFYAANNGSGTSFTTHRFASGWPSRVGSAAGDVNGDGKTDIGITCSESTNCDLAWYEQPNWTKHVITTGVSYVHTFKFADVDNDGDQDAVWGEMHQSDKDRVAVSLNKNGAGTSWETKIIDTTGIHNLRVGDIGGDGDIDIFGTNWSTDAPDKAAVKFYENISQRSGGTTGGSTGGAITTLEFKKVIVQATTPNDADVKTLADLSGDGKLDLIVGGSGDLVWFQYPNWTKRTIGGGGFATDMQAVDIDGDGDQDLIVPDAESGDRDILWFQNGGNGLTWTRKMIGHAGGHDIEVGDFNKDGRADVVARQDTATLFLNQNNGASWQKFQ